jgi:polyisoprenyl-teichoic acid--peptidoglycan teichoic acid transferase
MARTDKPYRVYRGGRTKGRVPALPRPGRGPSGEGYQPQGPVPVQPARRRRLGWGRRIALAVGLIVILLLAWGVLSYLAFRSGVEEANARLEDDARAALTPQSGLLLSKPTTILLLGTDHSSTIEQRTSARRSDSIMLLRTDPDRGRLAFLSIPRDLRVDIPGHGPGKVNAALQLGGPALAIQTVRALTDVPINHVALIDFDNFKEAIDAVGGITVDVPKPILSNRFDCPYDAERCQTWEGWRFAKGEQHMDGRRALVYARIRQNQLDPGENDITRAERHQRVFQALTRRLTSPSVLARMPLIGDDVVEPLATDLSAWEFMQLGWLRFRASSSQTLHCRLGGEASSIGGESFVIGTEENVAVLAMFVGASAPQPPLPGSGVYGPGCVVGSAAAL